MEVLVSIENDYQKDTEVSIQQLNQLLEITYDRDSHSYQSLSEYFDQGERDCSLQLQPRIKREQDQSFPSSVYRCCRLNMYMHLDSYPVLEHVEERLWDWRRKLLSLKQELHSFP